MLENSGLLRNMVRTSGYEPLIRGIGWVSELIGIVDPPAARLKELTGTDCRSMADSGDQVALAAP
jgi:hypothetical protein